MHYLKSPDDFLENPPGAVGTLTSTAETSTPTLYSLQNDFDTLTLLLLSTTCPVLANSVDPDQLASEEAN